MSKSSLRKNLFLIQTQLKHRAGQRTDIWVDEVFVFEESGLKQRTNKIATSAREVQNMDNRLGSTHFSSPQWKMNALHVEVSILL